MVSLLVKNATVLVTMDDERREIASGGLYADDGWIIGVGPSSELPATADVVVDARDRIVIPGLVNTHHHLSQTLTRAIPAAQDVGLFEWLRTLYPIWARMTPDDLRLATQVGVAELTLSGCTTVMDHTYLFPNGCRVDNQLQAALGVGVRFHASRGAMSLGASRGGLPPDSVVEDENSILADTARLIETYHNPQPGSMRRIVAAPCSPFSVTVDLMRQIAKLARQYGVTLHTHMAETKDEEDFCLATHGMRPIALAESVEWVGKDVSYAHAVHVDEAEIGLLAATGTCVAHCPTSNMRLASGIAPVRRYLEAGVHVGIGVDGSASNDGCDLLGEARQAMLLARLEASPGLRGGRLMPARTGLEMATRGGAAVLGRDDIGSLTAGKCADFAVFSLDRVEYAGALHDPVAALLLASPTRAEAVYVHGRAVVDGGRLTTVDLDRAVHQHNAAARRLVEAT
ncbi:MAG TPA: 8-oxoguanine deaminase [Acidimicrobiia bacterium]|jgi:cytosine/adenosine deaminase-related metal-dependent hydrolase